MNTLDMYTLQKIMSYCEVDTKLVLFKKMNYKH